MPARIPRRSLGLEVAVSLAVKVVALAAIGLLLFGPGDRVRPTPDTTGTAVVGAGG